MRPKSCLPYAIYLIQSSSFPSAFPVRSASSLQKLHRSITTWQQLSRNKRDNSVVNHSKQKQGTKEKKKADRRGARKSQAVSDKAKESWDVNESSPTRTGTKEWVPKQGKKHTEAANKTYKAKQEDQLNAKIVDDGSCVILINESNEVLLVQRTKKASNFPSAHVFPGGKHDDDQDGRLLGGSNKRYRDGPEHRRCALRELFEETGILLAKDTDTSVNEYLKIDQEVQERGRLLLATGEARFQPWIHSINKTAVPHISGLIPFTHWTTPANGQRPRFATQMYLYFLPISPDSDSKAFKIRSSDELKAYAVSDAQTPDNQEVISSVFAKPSEWSRKAQQNEIILFPPQFILLHLLKQHLEDFVDTSSPSSKKTHMKAQRDNFLRYINKEPDPFLPDTFSAVVGSMPIWKFKYISPRNLKTVDSLHRPPNSAELVPCKKAVLGLDWAGQELQAREGRLGDTEHVILTNFTPQGPRDLELAKRSDFMSLTEEKQFAMKISGPEHTKDFRGREMRKELLARLQKMKMDVFGANRAIRTFSLELGKLASVKGSQARVRDLENQQKKLIEGREKLDAVYRKEREELGLPAEETEEEQKGMIVKTWLDQPQNLPRKQKREVQKLESKL